jgi:hypothetical protein
MILKVRHIISFVDLALNYKERGEESFITMKLNWHDYEVYEIP